MQGDYPLAHTEATKMLAKAFERASKDKDWSQRTIARMLGYKTSVVLSHMASGRVPIPLDRAMDFARMLGMNQAEFLLAVIDQRHPDIDARRVLAQLGKGPKPVASDSQLVDQLEQIAGCALDELPVPIVSVLREVVGDRNAARRFMKMSEVPIIERLRRVAPDGLSPAQLKALEEAIEKL